MTASSSLSVELWQVILRYSIGVAEFLDPDAFEGVIDHHIFCDKYSSMNDERAYWSSERVRNDLQRVCKSWRAYLHPFGHRFVRMLDVYHEEVDSESLQKAIRVSFSRYNCAREGCCTNISIFGLFCWEEIQRVESMAMVIADMRAEQYQVARFMDIPQRFDNVRTFIGPSCGYSNSFGTLLLRLPSLRHFYGKGYRGQAEIGVHATLTAKDLVTLSCHTRRGSNYGDCDWDLPSLRHLRLKDDSDQKLSDFVEGGLLPILRTVGSQLHSLYLYHQAGDYDMPAEIWSLCPNVKRFRTGLIIAHPPPFFHPVQTLLVDRERQLDQIQALPEWPHLEKIVVDSVRRMDKTYIRRLVSRRNTRVENRGGELIDLDEAQCVVVPNEKREDVVDAMENTMP